MIDRKVGDKPITFEVSVGKCVKLFSKAERESQEKGMLPVFAAVSLGSGINFRAELTHLN